MSDTALITGGSRGLGRSTVLALADKGVNSIFTFVHDENAAKDVVAEAEKRGVKAVALQFDATKFSDYSIFISTVRTCLQQHFGGGKLKYLVNNAGTGLHKAFSETSMEEFDALSDLHLKAPYFLTQALLSDIEDNGHILNISSGLARFSLPGSSAYAVMKGGVEVLTRYLAKELGSRGISVNTIAPGAIATDFAGGTVRDNPDVNQFVSSVTAKGRVGEASDIGPAIAKILSDDCGWMTGQRVEISGGMFL